MLGGDGRGFGWLAWSSHGEVRPPYGFIMRNLRPRRSLTVTVTAFLTIASLLVGAAPSASAATGPLPRTGAEAAWSAGPIVRTATPGAFDPGLIISDYNFYNGWAMTEPEIQAFLDSRISGPCETGLCLNVLRLDTPTRTWGFGDCSTYQGAADESAARIIFKVQRACGISAKVILVTLQKEQGLVTRTDTTEGVLRKAMGYACPDSGSCDSTYYGFFNQVFAAARQLGWYGNPDGSFTWYEVGQTNQVRWYPAPAAGQPDCGSGPVVIANRATAALYYYTPYQPNASSLAAWPGASSDPCASYGNRNFYAFYHTWFGDPKAAPAVSVDRLAGNDRYETAVAISKSSFDDGITVPVAYVASGTGFADALSAGPAAAAEGGPVLLVEPNSVPPVTMSELKRVNPDKIVVVGETPSVSAEVASALQEVAPVTRIGGADRFETSRLIAAAAFSTAQSAYFATGRNFPDALSAGAAAGVAGVPVVLVDGASPTLDQATTDLLDSLDVSTVKVLGSPVSIRAEIDDAVQATGRAVERLSGSDRFHTSSLINADASFPSRATAYLATGLNFPDALAGAAAAARAGSPLYVTMPTCVTPELRSALNSGGVEKIVLLGGAPSLSDSIAYLPTC